MPDHKRKLYNFRLPVAMMERAKEKAKERDRGNLTAYVDRLIREDSEKETPRL